MQILQSQALIYDETRPGKDLCKRQWKLSSLMTHDFLLAAMLISLYLSHTAVDSSSSPAASPNQLPILWTRDELLRSLKESQKISEEASSSSRDAAKVAKALKVYCFLRSGEAGGCLQRLARSGHRGWHLHLTRAAHRRMVGLLQHRSIWPVDR
jgi:hypothetical protein